MNHAVSSRLKSRRSMNSRCHSSRLSIPQSRRPNGTSAESMSCGFPSHSNSPRSARGATAACRGRIRAHARAQRCSGTGNPILSFRWTIGGRKDVPRGALEEVLHLSAPELHRAAACWRPAPRSGIQQRHPRLERHRHADAVLDLQQRRAGSHAGRNGSSCCSTTACRDRLKTPWNRSNTASRSKVERKSSAEELQRAGAPVDQPEVPPVHRLEQPVLPEHPQHRHVPLAGWAGSAGSSSGRRCAPAPRWSRRWRPSSACSR